MVTKAEAVTAREYHYGTCTREVGPRGGITVKSEVWRRSGGVKLWVTRPEEFRVPIKFAGARGREVIAMANKVDSTAGAPAPWRVQNQFVVDARGGVVCDLSPSGPDGGEAVRGRLIAAAPELLAALREARAFIWAGIAGIPPEHAAPAMLKRFEAALAKAEGR